MSLFTFTFDMAQFLKKVLLFVVAFFVLEKGTYLVFELMVRSQYDNRIGLVLEGKVNKDVVVLGASRLSSTISPGYQLACCSGL